MRLALALATLAVVLLLPAASRAQWTAPKTVAVSPKQGCACGPGLALDARGRGVVVWQQIGATEDNTSVIKAVDVGTDLSLSRAVQVSPRGRQASRYRLAVAPDGQAAILFATAGPAHRYPAKREPSAVQLVTRPPGGTWSRPRTLSTGGRNFAKSVVIEPSGRVVAAWTHNRSRERKRVEVRTLTARGKRSLSYVRLPYGTVGPKLAASTAFPEAVMAYLETPQPVDAGPRTLHLRVGDRDFTLDTHQDRGVPRIAAADRLTLAWGHYSLDHEPDYDYELRTATLAPGDAEPKVEIRAQSPTDVVDRPSVGASGDDAVVTWVTANGYDGRFAQAHAGVFGAAVDLSPGTAVDSAPRTAVGGGRVVTTWSDKPTVGFAYAPLVAATAAPGGALGPPATLAPAAENADTVVPVVAADGSAMVAYRRVDLLSPDERPYTLRVVRLAP